MVLPSVKSTLRVARIVSAAQADLDRDFLIINATGKQIGMVATAIPIRIS
jgi:hypothetical protein